MGGDQTRGFHHTAVGHQWLVAAMAGMSRSPGWARRRGAGMPWHACLLPGAVLPCERAGRKTVDVS